MTLSRVYLGEEFRHLYIRVWKAWPPRTGKNWPSYVSGYCRFFLISILGCNHPQTNPSSKMIFWTFPSSQNISKLFEVVVLMDCPASFCWSHFAKEENSDPKSPKSSGVGCFFRSKGHEILISKTCLLFGCCGWGWFLLFQTASWFKRTQVSSNTICEAFEFAIEDGFIITILIIS